MGDRELRERLEAAQARSAFSRVKLAESPDVEAEIAPLRDEAERLERGRNHLWLAAEDRDRATQGLRRSVDAAGRIRMSDFGKNQGYLLVRTALGLGAAAVGAVSGGLLLTMLGYLGTPWLVTGSAISCVVCAWVNWRIGHDG